MSVTDTHSQSAPAPVVGTGTGTGSSAAPAGGTTQDAPRVRVLVGVTFDINGEPVTVTSGDVANALEKGIEFRLPRPVPLGTLNDLTGYLHEKFDVPADLLSTLPGPFHGIGTTLGSTLFTVEEFHVKVPPRDASAEGAAATRGPTMYTMMMSATPAVPIDITDNLKMERFHFGVSNEPEPAPDAVGAGVSAAQQALPPVTETPPVADRTDAVLTS